MKYLPISGFLALSFLAACTSLQPTEATYKEEHRKICNYTIGVPYSVSVGDAVIKRADYVVRISNEPVMAPESAINYSAGIPLNKTFQAVLGEGTKYPIAGTLDGRSAIIVGRTNRGVPVGLLVDANDIFDGRGVWQNGFGGWSSGGGASFRISPVGVHFQRGINERVDTKSKYENFEIIYTGRSKTSVNLLYREFTPDDLARTAFFQNLSFDLDEGDTIAFKSFRIRVIRADNQTIRVQVERDV